MSFNVGSYVKESAKTLQQRMVDDAVDAAFSALPLNTQALAQTAAGAFLGIGASTDSIDTFTREVIDTVISETLGEFRELAGAVSGDAANGRNIEQSVNAFLAVVNPTTKIAKSKNSELEVIVVV